MLIYSWNINGFNTCDRSEGFSHMLQMQPDIICLQEVKVSEPDVLNTFYTLQDIERDNGDWNASL